MTLDLFSFTIAEIFVPFVGNMLSIEEENNL